MVSVEDAACDVLDDYVEAHVHGPLLLEEDVPAIVLDPSFESTAVGDAAERFSVPVVWHHGFRVHVDELARHPDYRGPHIVEVGRAIARDGWLTPRVIGDAVADGGHDPQHLKYVWHCVARFGHPWPDSSHDRGATGRD